MADLVARVSGLYRSGNIAGIQTSLRRIAAPTPNVQSNDRFLRGAHPPLQRHPPDDVERRLWGRLESGRWSVANKRTMAVGRCGEKRPGLVQHSINDETSEHLPRLPLQFTHHARPHGRVQRGAGVEGAAGAAAEDSGGNGGGKGWGRDL